MAIMLDIRRYSPDFGTGGADTTREVSTTYRHEIQIQILEGLGACV
jgi:hypothetical protein